MLGYLVSSGLIKDGKPYYCPSETNPQWLYNFREGGGATATLSANPWPFDPPGTGFETRLGYACRPDIGWCTPPNGGPQKNQEFVNSAGKVTSMPKMQQYKAKAILSDACLTPLHLQSRHKKGINVLYGMGNAKWVPKEQFMKAGEAFTGIPYPPNDVSVYNSGYNGALLLEYGVGGVKLPNPTGQWIDFDRY
jgi:hypothetical protein